MKIITRGVIDWATLQVEEEDAYEYAGPVALAKDSGSAPAAVDPYTQAAAQYGLSTGTAAYNAGLNRTNQTNPLGSSYWSTNTQPAGTAPSQYYIPNPNGPSYTPQPNGGTGTQIPTPSQSPQAPANPVTYTPFLGTSGGSAYPDNPYASLPGASSVPGGPTSGTGIYGLGGPPPNYTLNTQLAPQFQSMLQSPIDTSGLPGMPGSPSIQQNLTDTQNAVYGQEMGYAQPEEQLASEQLNSQLANEGATPGSAAYNNEQARLGRQQTFTNQQAADSAITAGEQEQQNLFGLGTQGLQNQLAVRNAPISEYNALSGAPGASATALTPDISGAFNQQLNSQLAGYNANVASNNATTGDAATLAMLAYLAFSDERLKEDITEVGKTHEGLPVYTYRLKGDPEMRMGVMAQDVEKEQPHAAFSFGGPQGPKMVNYGAIR